MINNNIQGVVNDSNQNQNISGVQNDFYTNQTFSGDILNDTIPDNQLDIGLVQNISVNNCVNETNLSVNQVESDPVVSMNQVYVNNSGVNEINQRTFLNSHAKAFYPQATHNEYNFPTNNSCVPRNVPVGNVCS